MLSPQEKLDNLQKILEQMGTVLIAYSGGVDSAFLASLAHKVLGPKALAVYGRSPLSPPDDFDNAASLAVTLGLRLRILETNAMEDPAFVANTIDRCYLCKRGLLKKLLEIARDEHLAWVADGTNHDDLGDYRPGKKACEEMGIRSPLLEAGLTKADIRQLSRELGLPTWNKPASPCLVTRIPYGMPVTVEILRTIAAGERILRDLGFTQLRLRHHGEMARIEVDEKDIVRVLDGEMRHKIVAALKSLGYLYVTLDLAGYRTGSMNAAIAAP
jgi:uncharacterized protein